MKIQDADAVTGAEGNIKCIDSARYAESCVVGDPKHAQKHPERESGDPTASHEAVSSWLVL
jgi:hypothetical protein